MGKFYSKKLITSVIAASMMAPTISSLQMNAFAADDTDEISSTLDVLEESETYADKFGELTEGTLAYEFCDIIGQLYGIKQGETDDPNADITDAAIARLAIKLSDFNYEALMDIEAKMARLSEIKMAMSDLENLTIASKCPARTAAYLTLEANYNALLTANDLADQLESIPSNLLTDDFYYDYYLYQSNIEGAENIYKYIVDNMGTDETASRSYMYLKDVYKVTDDISLNYIDLMTEYREAFEKCKAIQKKEFEDSVDAIEPMTGETKDEYTYNNFIEKVSLLNNAKSKWDNIQLDDLIAELKDSSEKYSRFDTICGLELEYIDQITAETTDAYKEVLSLNTDMDKFEERKVAMDVVLQSISRLVPADSSHPYSDYASWTVSGEYTLGVIFDTIQQYIDIYNTENDFVIYSSETDPYVSKYCPGEADPVDYEYTKDDIQNDYSAIYDKIEAGKNYISLYTEQTGKVTSSPNAEANIQKVQERIDLLQRIIDSMTNKASVYLSDIYNEYETTRNTEDKFTTEYIDSINAITESFKTIEETYPKVAELDSDVFNSTVEIKNDIYNELADVVSEQITALNATYDSIKGSLADSNLRYDTYLDGLDSARELLAEQSGIFDAQNAAYDIISYYKDNVDNELVLPYKESAETALTEYSTHIDKIQGLRDAASAASASWDACFNISKDQTNFDSLYEFIKANILDVNEGLSSMDDATVIFAELFASLNGDMETYIGLCNDYIANYADEDFKNAGAPYLEEIFYNDWSDIKAYAEEFVMVSAEGNEGAYYDAKNIADAFIEKFMQNYSCFEELALNTAENANTQYALGYSDIKSLITENIDIENEYAANIKGTSSRYFVSSEIVDVQRPYIASEIVKWEKAIALTDRIDEIKAVFDQKEVRPNYVTNLPEYYIPEIEGIKIDTLADGVLADYMSYQETADESVPYISTDAISDLNDSIALMNEDKQRLDELKEKLAYVNEWKTCVGTNAAPGSIVVVTDVSNLDPEMEALINECVAQKAEIDADPDKWHYANKTDGEDVTADYKDYVDYLDKVVWEYKKTKIAGDFDTTLSAMADMEETERRAAFDEIDAWFNDESNEAEISDVLMRMSKYALYTEYRSQYYQSDEKAFEAAVNDIGTVDAVSVYKNSTQISEKIAYAEELRNGLNEVVLGSAQVQALSAVLDDCILIFERWSNAMENVSDIEAAISQYKADVDNAVASSDTSGFEEYETRYNDILAMITSMDDEASVEFMEANSSDFRKKLELSYKTYQSSFVYYEVYLMIEDLHSRYQSEEESYFNLAQALVDTEQAYASLSGDMKVQVSNYGKLTAIRRAYDSAYIDDLNGDNIYNFVEMITSLEEPTFTTYEAVEEEADRILVYVNSLSANNKQKLKDALGENSGRLDDIKNMCALYSNKGGKPGDIDDNGHVYINDVTFMINVIMNVKTFDNLGQELRADVNWNGVFDDDDIMSAIDVIEYTVE